MFAHRKPARHGLSHKAKDMHACSSYTSQIKRRDERDTESAF